MSGATALAPCLKPASNFWISGVCTPPTNPMWQDFVFSAAAAPTRNEPSCSANSSGVTLGTPSAVLSISANLTFGAVGATASTAGSYLKPTAMTGLKPPETSWRSRPLVASSLSPTAAVSSLLSATPSCALARSSPAAAASLKDASPRPPTSKDIPTLSAPAFVPGAATGGAAGAGAPVGAGLRLQSVDAPLAAEPVEPESFAQPTRATAAANSTAVSTVARRIPHLRFAHGRQPRSPRGHATSRYRRVTRTCPSRSQTRIIAIDKGGVMDEASVTIEAAPEQVWPLVSDVTKYGRFSPGNTGGKWILGASGPAVGAR